MAQLETPFPDILLGSIRSRVVDPEDPGTPQTIIETDDDWYVDVNWELCGPLAPFMCGQFKVQVYLEDIAATNFEGQVGDTQIVDLDEAPANQKRSYHRDIVVKAGKVPTGIYKLTTVLTYSNLGVNLELAGFDEGPMIQLYEKVGDNP